MTEIQYNILDYSEHVCDCHVYHDHGGKRKLLRLPDDYKRLYEKKGYCPFCKQFTTKVFDEYRTDEYKNHWDALEVWECEICGWWECSGRYEDENDWTPNEDDYRRYSAIYGVLRKFESGSKNLPVESLVVELKKNQSVLYEIHPTKLEELAQYVFSAYYDCTVKHVGKSHDGGIDLIIVDKDDPVLVSVKRRSKKDSVESVSTIRDLLGAMLIEGRARGLVLSTACRFSISSKKVIAKVLEQQKVDTFELVDFERFCAMLRLANSSVAQTWRQFTSLWKESRYWKYFDKDFLE